MVAGNLIDNAAAGISITNLDQGGQLAVCSGNIVRNVTLRSPTNPDVHPYGIYAEAETTITGNTVENIAGPGIVAGNGPYLRNVVISDNILSGADTGIAVSVADKAGTVLIANNLIAEAKAGAIVGMAWDKVVDSTLDTDAGPYGNVTVMGNIVTP